MPPLIAPGVRGIGGELDVVRVEAVEIEELGMSEEVEVGIREVEVGGGEVVGRGDGVEVGEVLGDVRRATAAIIRRHRRERGDGRRPPAVGDVGGAEGDGVRTSGAARS